jgi:2-methylcitrate dehydratase PrpD
LPFLVRAGFSGSPTSVEEIYGNGLLGNHFDADKLTEELGTDFYLMETYFKFYSFCRFCHSPIDAILEMLKEKTLSPKMVERIDVYTYSLAAKLSHQHVENDFAGKFSIPYAIASMFFTGENSEEILPFAKKVFVYEDPDYTNLLPYQRKARVEVITTDNENATVTVTGAKGDANEENLEENVIEKCKRTLQPILGEAKATQLVELVMNLEEIDNMKTLMELTRPSNE